MVKGKNQTPKKTTQENVRRESSDTDSDPSENVLEDWDSLMDVYSDT